MRERWVAILSVTALLVGCVSGAPPGPSTSDDRDPTGAEGFNRTFETTGGGAVWTMPVQVTTLEGTRTLIINGSEDNTTLSMIGQASVHGSHTSPIYVLLISEEGYIFPVLAKSPVPDVTARDDQATWETPLRTNVTGRHLLVVAYEATPVEFAVDDTRWIEPLGDWSVSDGQVAVVDDRPVSEDRPGAGPGLTAGPAVYSYEEAFDLEGSVYVHTFHIVKEGYTRVSLDGPPSWEVQTRVVPGEPDAYKGYGLRLPPGDWSLGVEVQRADGFQSTVLIEVPEGPALPFREARIFDRTIS